VPTTRALLCVQDHIVAAHQRLDELAAAAKAASPAAFAAAAGARPGPSSGRSAGLQHMCCQLWIVSLQPVWLV
jgi:hypothetical protein